jgi:DNA invertase Pin-like site-specific DNA recombinase
VIVDQLDRIGRGKSSIFEDFLMTVTAAGIAVLSVVDGLLTEDGTADEFQNADKEMLLSIKMAIVRQEKRKLSGENAARAHESEGSGKIR